MPIPDLSFSVPATVVAAIVAALCMTITYLFKLLFQAVRAEKANIERRLAEISAEHESCGRNLLSLTERIGRLEGSIRTTDEIYTVILRAIQDNRQSNTASSTARHPNGGVSQED